VIFIYYECEQNLGHPKRSTRARTKNHFLEELRQSIEKSAQRVTACSAALEERHRLSQGLHERLRSLGEMASKVTATIEGLPKPRNISEEDKLLIAESIPTFSLQLGVLVEEALRLKNDAASANMRNLERNSDSLRQTLQSARNHLNLLVRKNSVSAEATMH
jgi:seryl-tRNA synthetase